MQTGAVGRCTWKVDVSRVMCRISCLVFFYNKSLLFYSCFTKIALVPSLYYLICDKLFAVNGWKSSWIHQWNTRGGEGLIDWVQMLSTFTDGLIGRLILCNIKCLWGIIVDCRWCGFCSATTFSYAGWILSLTPSLFNFHLPNRGVFLGDEKYILDRVGRKSFVYLFLLPYRQWHFSCQLVWSQ